MRLSLNLIPRKYLRSWQSNPGRPGAEGESYLCAMAARPIHRKSWSIGLLSHTTPLFYITIPLYRQSYHQTSILYHSIIVLCLCTINRTTIQSNCPVKSCNYTTNSNSSPICTTLPTNYTTVPSLQVFTSVERWQNFGVPWDSPTGPSGWSANSPRSWALCRQPDRKNTEFYRYI